MRERAAQRLLRLSRKAEREGEWGAVTRLQALLVDVEGVRTPPAQAAQAVNVQTVQVEATAALPPNAIPPDYAVRVVETLAAMSEEEHQAIESFQKRLTLALEKQRGADDGRS